MMLAIASAYSGEKRYTIHPQKTNIVCKRCTSKSSEDKNRQWKMGSNIIESASETTHLGLIRSEEKENARNIEDRISLARRTWYSLMKSGFHGSNGFGPKVSYKIYQSYILPRLLYSLEVLNLNKTETKTLNDFHVDLLRRIQSLLSRTALPAVHLLLGALPLEAELHKKHLSLLYSIINSNNQTFHQLIKRSIVFCEDQPGSFFSRVRVILGKYGLPPMEHLMQELPSKLQWKRQVKAALADYWTRTLVNEGRTRSTLQQCCLEKLEIGKIHRVWNSVRPNLQDVRRAHIKARVLTGTYILQSTKAKFNNQQVDPKCPLCRLESEDLSHFLLRCPALSTVRELHIKSLRDLVIEKVGHPLWLDKFCSETVLLSLIIDCEVLVERDMLPRCEQTLNAIQISARTLCYSLHLKRLNLHKHLL